MKHLRKLKYLIVSAVVAVSVLLCTSPVSARMRHHHIIRSHSKKSGKNTVTLTPEQTKIFFICLGAFFVLVISIILISSRRAKRKNKRWVNVPSHTEEILQQMAQNDPSFYADGLKDEITGILSEAVIAYTAGNTVRLRSVETERLFRFHEEKLRTKKASLLISSVTPLTVKLLKYEIRNGTEALTVNISATVGGGVTHGQSARKDYFELHLEKQPLPPDSGFSEGSSRWLLDNIVDYNRIFPQE